jgi:hypothetical protein
MPEQRLGFRFFDFTAVREVVRWTPGQAPPTPDQFGDFKRFRTGDEVNFRDESGQLVRARVFDLKPPRS